MENTNCTLEACQQIDSTQLLEIEDVLSRITDQLRSMYTRGTANAAESNVAAEKQQELINNVEAFIVGIVAPLSKMEAPIITFRNISSWNNIIFNETIQLKPAQEAKKVHVRFGDRRSFPKFGLITFLVAKIYKLLMTNASYSIREFYDQNTEYIKKQDFSDAALAEITCMFDCPLHVMNLHPDSKGKIFGPAKLQTISGLLDCATPGGSTIPSNVNEVVAINSSAKFIIVVEKGAIFDLLIKDGMRGSLSSCIFVTGKGMPDRNTRALLNLMWESLGIPIFMLADPDPWGIAIFCIYKFGSMAMSHQVDTLPVPSMQLLGVKPSEIGASPFMGQALNCVDEARLLNLRQCPYIRNNVELLEEVNIMANNKRKANMDSMELLPNYLKNTYIPKKLFSFQIDESNNSECSQNNINHFRSQTNKIIYEKFKKQTSVYEAIVDIIKYVIRQNQEDLETAKGRYLQIKIIENQDNSGGLVQVNVMAPWISKFNIHSLDVEVMQVNKLSFSVHFANIPEIYYVYTITYKDGDSMPILNLETEDKPFIEDCTNYLSFVIKLSTEELHKVALKLKEYVQSSAEKIPNINMHYEESESVAVACNETRKIVKMISGGIGEVIEYSLTRGFRNQVFDILEVNSRDAAVKKLYKLILDTHCQED